MSMIRNRSRARGGSDFAVAKAALLHSVWLLLFVLFCKRFVFDIRLESSFYFSGSLVVERLDISWVKVANHYFCPFGFRNQRLV